MAVAPLDEHELIKQLRAQNEAALGAFMAQYETRVFGLALRLTGNRQDAEEVLQDVFLTVFQKIDSFRGDSKLSSWLYRIATNAALMKLRKRPKVQQIPLEEELGPGMTEDGMIAEPVVDWSRLPNDELDRKELGQRIEQAMNLLPADYRSVVVLRDVEGLSAQEACEVLSLSEAALKSRLHRGRLFLRKQLADYAVSRTAPSSMTQQTGVNPGPQHA
ncbi:MAG: RNA polymerase subunit sigma [Candidatus Omnitrophica bacterium CG11_big_fil_rev_8_21_14_0_20_63_9]|nr:MAG: RNA polymerase subunit sigma [Candidatus Omnitrophica bacterium CG11_big_fil_rev_8_21_14_0_20_63_9]